MASILSALAAIPQILSAVKSILAFVEANKNERWFQESTRVFSELQKAKTEQDYKDAAKNIRNILGSV